MVNAFYATRPKTLATGVSPCAQLQIILKRSLTKRVKEIKTGARWTGRGGVPSDFMVLSLAQGPGHPIRRLGAHSKFGSRLLEPRYGPAPGALLQEGKPISVTAHQEYYTYSTRPPLPGLCY